MLEVSNLEVVYQDVVLVLRGVSLEAPEGSIVALLGANGAGKTTTARAITGLLDVHEGEVTKGSIRFAGKDITRRLPSERVRMGISQVMEGRRIFAEMTVEENLAAGSYINRDRNASRRAHDRVMTLFPTLAERRSQVAGYMSGGEQQVLAIARALMQSPRLMILDEPSLGLAPRLVELIAEVIVEINRQGTAVLLIEQNAHMALSIANKGYVMENGKVVMEGAAEKLLADEDVQEFYLGLRAGERKSYREVKHYKRRKRWLS